MGSLTSRFGRPRFGRLVVVAGLLLAFGCGGGGSGPTVAEPPKGTPESPTTPAKAPKKQRTKSVEPTGAQ